MSSEPMLILDALCSDRVVKIGHYLQSSSASMSNDMNRIAKVAAEHGSIGSSKFVLYRPDMPAEPRIDIMEWSFSAAKSVKTEDVSKAIRDGLNKRKAKTSAEGSEDAMVAAMNKAAAKFKDEKTALVLT